MNMDHHWCLSPGKAGLATVIVTAYNQDWVLAETLKSVASQTYRPLECVIVDDGSSDDTPNIIARFIEEHHVAISINSIRQPNRGAQLARDAGVQASTGEFVQFLDGDDLLRPDKLAVQIDFLSSPAGKNTVIVYGDAKWLYDDGQRVVEGEKIGLGPVRDVLESLLDVVKFNPPFSYLCRRTILERCGGWDSRLRINDDVEYFLRMACRALQYGGEIRYISAITGLYRKHTRGRMSDGGVLLRAQCGLLIYQSVEALMTKAGLFTAGRRRALARAYYAVSCWASAFDQRTWEQSLRHALRLDPELEPERFISRCLQKAVGMWNSERILRRARSLKQRLRVTSEIAQGRAQ